LHHSSGIVTGGIVDQAVVELGMLMPGRLNTLKASRFRRSLNRSPIGKTLNTEASMFHSLGAQDLAVV